MNIEKIAKEIFFHAQAYKQDVIDKNDFTQAVEDIEKLEQAIKEEAFQTPIWGMIG